MIDWKFEFHKLYKFLKLTNIKMLKLHFSIRKNFVNLKEIYIH